MSNYKLIIIDIISIFSLWIMSVPNNDILFWIKVFVGVSAGLLNIIKLIEWCYKKYKKDEN